jgi:hypothetical protein
MNTRATLFLFSVIVPLAVRLTALADTSSTDSNGLYYVSSHVTAPQRKDAYGTTVFSYEKAEIRILKAHVYSVNNSNTDFRAYLNTTDNPFGPKPGSVAKPLALRVGNHTYSCAGWGGNTMEFMFPNQNEAKAGAEWLSVDCTLRTPPGYKFSAQFVPNRAALHTNEPVLVNFAIKNLDDRTITFEYFGAARAQFDFRATLNGRPVHDKLEGDPMKGVIDTAVQLVNVDPGEEFGREFDLKGWFAFDKAGTYKIHASHRLEFFRKPVNRADDDPVKMWNELWSDSASADFTIVVK